MLAKSLVQPLLVCMSLFFAGAALAAANGAVHEEQAADGAVELTNILPADAQTPAPAEPAAAGDAAAKATTQQTSTEPPPKDPREAYRDKMRQGANADGSPTTAANPSVSRRYKMMDKETYRREVLGITPEQDAKAASSNAAK